MCKRAWFAGMGLAAAGLASACKFPPPADVPDDDVELRDGASDGAADAPARTHPVLQDHQAADLVIGQPNFDIGTVRPFGPRFVSSVSVSGTGERLWASDGGMNRVLLFRPFPSSNDPAGVMALGRDNFTDYLADVTLSGASFTLNGGIVDTGTALLVVDSSNNRVLIWTTIPGAARQPADLVLGQVGLEARVAGAGADNLSAPTDVWSDGNRVVVADAGNHRVLIWRSFPTRHGQPADVVIGQSAFGQGAAPPSPTGRNVFAPAGVVSDGRRLVVADTGHRRVLVWNDFPDTNGAAASLAIGQRDLTSAMLTQDGDPHGLRPNDVAVIDNAVIVADGANQRVLVFDPIPTASLADATRAQQALGQPNPTVVNLNQAATERSMGGPHSVGVVNGSLFVSDPANNRVLRYRLDLP